MSSEATMFSQTVIPDERNDTVTIKFPRHFYGYQVSVSCTRVPSPVSKPASNATPPEVLAALKAKMPKVTKEQLEAWRDDPWLKELRKTFEGIEKTFPPGITRDEIREMRLKEKYGI